MTAMEARTRRDIPSGWRVIAAKELADHLASVRFFVLLIVLGIAALIPLYFASETIRSLADQASGARAIFLALFTFHPQGVSFLSVQSFVAMAAPLLGIGFAFDAINGERAEGTLPRLLSQPIHRDDVINGKFVGGLAVIAVVLAVMVAAVAAFGMLRLGIVPAPDDVVRLIGWFGVTVLYVAVWLAFGLLLSVVVRRAATSALVGFGVWLFVAVPLFGPLLAQFLGGFLAAGAKTDADYAGTIQWAQRLLPGQIYAEASAALLSPGVTTVSASEIYSDQYGQQLQASALTVDQSVLLVWPHIVWLIALASVCFAVAYIRFMRQEVRA